MVPTATNSFINSSLRFSNYWCLASFVLIAPLILFFRADRENTLAVHLRTCVTVFNPSLWPQIFYLHSIRRSQPIRGLTPKKRETTEFVELFAKPTHDGCWWWGWCWKWRHHRNGCFSEPGKGGGAEKRNILGGEKRSTTRPGLSPLSSFPNFPSYAIILNLGKNAATLPCRLIKKRCAYVCQPNQHT